MQFRGSRRLNEYIVLQMVTEGCCGNMLMVCTIKTIALSYSGLSPDDLKMKHTEAIKRGQQRVRFQCWVALFSAVAKPSAKT